MGLNKKLFISFQNLNTLTRLKHLNLAENHIEKIGEYRHLICFQSQGSVKLITAPAGKAPLFPVCLAIYIHIL